ncbi:Maf-like protein [Flavobacterium lindanitolerans]|uniref:dTTP/UTP pyrophosphatase n=1 Tax=Flavobacterium lindanitolerans TaxID=428988 RepID=A0A497UHW6_9FLAO|nr:Maf-like protein [Flavobacterium lindanitolerans]MBC8644489.1 septum formation protein Maf [Flavobacterium lindanitolerans]PKW20920.1 septum formation protein [Flavobacterium lindanitolerans]RLJ30441.1 septum formation protein [Flavobacterium lindanitolerans]
MLNPHLKNYTILLASGSPRRQQFFKDMHLDFEVRLKEVDEIYPEHLKASEITDFLAKLKADAFQDELAPNDILVTSDTIVWHNGKALGKPKDYDDAFQILRALSDSTHKVYTSVCFRHNGKTDIINEVTKVTFAHLSDEAIAYYLDNFKPYDKAGAYGIQEWIGIIGISKIEGSYSNVVGLPVQKVYEYFTTFGKNS